MSDALQEQIAQRFPQLYHFGPVANRAQIERLRTILSSDLIRALSAIAGDAPNRRLDREPVETPLGTFLLNDQAALAYGHVKDPESLSEAEFVRLLDQFTFFWPGTDQGPIQMGRNFVDRYVDRGDRLLRVAVETRAFFAANHPCRVLLSTCNSGAPRSNPRAVIYRGYDTFEPLFSYSGSVSDIKEVAVLGYARLPEFRLTEVEKPAEQGAAADRPRD
jgi:hypothetical protein